MKNLKCSILLIICLIGLWVFLVYSKKSPQRGEKQSENIEVERLVLSTSISKYGDITCTFEQVTQASYENNMLKYSINKPEKSPLVFTFRNVSGDNPKLSVFDATKTISEYDLVKVDESDQKIVFVESLSNANTLYTIFLDEGVALYSKQVSVLGIPVATTALGACK